MTHHHDHTHNHDDNHTHGHETDGLSVKEKLATLFEHWIRHNESHGQTYMQWANRAKEEGLADISAGLSEVAELTDKITEKLKSAAASVK